MPPMARRRPITRENWHQRLFKQGQHFVERVKEWYLYHQAVGNVILDRAELKFNAVAVTKKKSKVGRPRRAQKRGVIFQARPWWKRTQETVRARGVALLVQGKYLLSRKRRRGRPKVHFKTLRRYYATTLIWLAAAKAWSLETKDKTTKNVLIPSWKAFKGFPWATFISLVVTAGILLSAYAGYDYIFRDLPSANDLVNHHPIVSTKILDRHGRLLYNIYKDENRSLIPLSQIPPHMVQATIAIEDKEFYSHHGFSFRGIIRAAKANFEGKPVQGGSTITQQLVKNTLLSPERTFRRKIREMLLSIVVDASFTKDEILGMYFNEIPYGGSTYGVEEASRRFFGKSARELTLAESTYLAGLPAAPSAYSPYGSTPELGYLRQAEVLRRMVEDGYITQEQADQARTEKLQFRQDSVDILAPHFVFYIREMLAKQYGEEILNQGGLTVRTSLDLDVQNAAQQAVVAEVTKLKNLRVNNGAALVTNPRTGEVLAMVGSVNYFDFVHDGQVNVTLRPRQPGSSIKPLTYAIAMERGLITPSSRIDDSAITFNIPGSVPYTPKNYDGKYHGSVTVRQALGSSYNIPAVKVLNMIGLNTMIDRAQELGITTWQERQRFGLSLTLGGGEVLMSDMATAYSAFANYGYSVPLNPILEVTDYSGKQLYRNSCALDTDNCFGKQTLDPRVAYQITDILKDNQARTPAFGPVSVLNIPGQEVAVKTGTTNNLRDNWTFGYTSDRLVATWVGNNDSTSMSYVVSGITGASPIWNNIMRSLLSTDQPHHFPALPGLIKVAICKTTGTLACKGCPSISEEFFIPGTQPTQACNPNWFSKPQSSSTPKQPRDKILDGAQTGN
jgi:1A family penicillin-binding protein